MYKIIVFLLIFFSVTSVYSSSKLCDEDFESVTLGCVPEINPTGSGEISESARTFYMNCTGCSDGIGTGCDTATDGSAGAFISTDCSGGSGCVRVYLNMNGIDGDSYSEPKLRFDSKFNDSTEIYLKFDLKLDPNLGTSNATREVYNFKIIRITSYIDAGSGSSNDWHPQINFQPSSTSYGFYSWSQGDCYTEYYFSRATTRLENHLMDNQWHTIEIYMDIGTAVVSGSDDPSADGVVRIWEDGVLILEDNAVPYRCSSDEGIGIKSMAFIRHAKSLGAPVSPMIGNLYFDNIQVWDGMPNTSSNAIISNTQGHFRLR